MSCHWNCLYFLKYFYAVWTSTRLIWLKTDMRSERETGAKFSARWDAGGRVFHSRCRVVAHPCRWKNWLQEVTWSRKSHFRVAGWKWAFEEFLGVTTFRRTGRFLVRMGSLVNSILEQLAWRVKIYCQIQKIELSHAYSTDEWTEG